MRISEQLESLRTGAESLAPSLEAILELIGEEEGKLHAMVDGKLDRGRIASAAEGLLSDYPEADDRPPLFGLPIGVKDIFRVDGFPTGCGSRLPSSLFEGAEASVVTRLKAAGAIVVGKTATTEFACYSPGPTRNPHNLEHTPGGSSSGSAAGVSKGYFPVALGTQTAGSVIRPAAYCGVVGFKPSMGRIRTDGVIPVSPSLDHVGFFCEDLSGISPVARVLIPGWQTEPERIEVAGSLLGVPVGPYLQRASGRERDLFGTAVARIQEAGFKIIYREVLGDIEAIRECHRKIMEAELARIHKGWYRDFKTAYRPKTAEMIKRGLEIDDAELEALLTLKEANCHRIIQETDAAGIDFWLTPAATDHAPEGLHSTGDPIMNLPWTHFGMPSLSIPSGFDEEGLPHGLQIIGRFGRDEALLRLAEALSSGPLFS